MLNKKFLNEKIRISLKIYSNNFSSHEEQSELIWTKVAERKTNYISFAHSHCQQQSKYRRKIRFVKVHREKRWDGGADEAWKSSAKSTLVSRISEKLFKSTSPLVRRLKNLVCREFPKITAGKALDDTTTSVCVRCAREHVKNKHNNPTERRHWLNYEAKSCLEKLLPIYFRLNRIIVIKKEKLCCQPHTLFCFRRIIFSLLKHSGISTEWDFLAIIRFRGEKFFPVWKFN